VIIVQSRKFLQVKFDNNNVTSVDWLNYPILDMTEAPDQLDVVLRSALRSPTPYSTPPVCG
jgi:hypothetical protein